ncbi:MAG: hypothetical protein JW982_11875 [Spirochaetes bacterium]|nr:hypothetical protein [Spirochaetota bacterium]
MKIVEKAAELDSRHPYMISFVISAVFMVILLFKVSFYGDIKNAAETVTQLEFISMDEMKSPKRKVTREITTEPSDDTNENSDVERAVGTSDAEDAIDISFYPNIAQPKVIGKLKRIYPSEAMTDEIEATVNVELLISAEGKVLKVTILGIRLSKDLPPDRYASISESFIRDVKKILNGARFTPPIVNGHAVPIKMSYPFKFKLLN